MPLTRRGANKNQQITPVGRTDRKNQRKRENESSSSALDKISQPNSKKLCTPAKVTELERPVERAVDQEAIEMNQAETDQYKTTVSDDSAKANTGKSIKQTESNKTDLTGEDSVVNSESRSNSIQNTVIDDSDDVKESLDQSLTQAADHQRDESRESRADEKEKTSGNSKDSTQNTVIAEVKESLDESLTQEGDHPQHTERGSGTDYKESVNAISKDSSQNGKALLKDPETAHTKVVTSNIEEEQKLEVEESSKIRDTVETKDLIKIRETDELKDGIDQEHSQSTTKQESEEAAISDDTSAESKSKAVDSITREQYEENLSNLIEGARTEDGNESEELEGSIDNLESDSDDEENQIDYSSDSHEASYLKGEDSEELEGARGGEEARETPVVNAFDIIMSHGRKPYDPYQTTSQRDFSDPRSKPRATVSEPRAGTSSEGSKTSGSDQGTGRGRGAETKSTGTGTKGTGPGAGFETKGRGRGAQGSGGAKGPAKGATGPSGRGATGTGAGAIPKGTGRGASSQSTASHHTTKGTSFRWESSRKASHLQNDNLRFYNGEIRSYPNGDFIYNIHNSWYGDYRKLEAHHGYIQWLFPIREQGMNYSAQELQEHEIEAMKKIPKVRQRLQKSYEMMLDFYGMRLVNKETGQVARASHWIDRAKHLNRSHHNFLRITRIIKCLGMLGFEHYQVPLVEFLLHETFNKKTLGSARKSCLKFWIPSVKDEGEKDRLWGIACDMQGEEEEKGVLDRMLDKAKKFMD